ncbi:hypothetical protein HPB51_027211 [Rhipicephalus microplus]|uniref:Uncharacterized protein n=1 Tax=Rhipicephalus microplus TaxID=6941 RepID=A0A9J6D0P1_RHIMP|nr:hypothetical protein HPB51_027211 [Rhipicephalus microplus]
MDPGAFYGKFAAKVPPDYSDDSDLDSSSDEEPENAFLARTTSPEQAVKRFDKKTRTTVSYPALLLSASTMNAWEVLILLDMLVALYRIPRKRQRVSDETAERILERIAGTAPSDIHLSDSDDDTLVDTTFSAPLYTMISVEYENSDDERPSTSKMTMGQSWKRHDGPLPSWIPDFTFTPDDSKQRVSWSPSDYLLQYVPHEVFEMMAFAMNTTTCPGDWKKSGDLSRTQNVFGISLTMSCLCYSQIRNVLDEKDKGASCCG